MENDASGSLSSLPRRELQDISARTAVYDNENNKIAVQGSQNIHGNQYIYVNDSGPMPRPAPAESPSNRSFDETERAFLEFLRPNPFFGREDQVAKRLEGTLEWITQDPDYLSWLSNPANQVLLVTGDPGHGKSVLASHIKELLQVIHPQKLICSFFFDGTRSVTTELGHVLRSLVVQLATKRPKLLKILRKAARDAELQGEQLGRNIPALWRLFKTLVAHKRTRGIFIVLDAIDECTRRVQVGLMEDMIACLESETTCSVKILITSRPGAPAVAIFATGITAVQRLSLEKKDRLIKKDVRVLIHERLAKLVKTGQWHPQAQAELESALSKTAEGSFLWVSLILPWLDERGILKTQNVVSICEQIPSDLGDIYDRLLDSIPTPDREPAHRLLMFIIMCSRPPTVDELKILLAIEQPHQSVRDVEQAYTIAGPQSILAVLGGLVKLSETTVHVIHHTLKEYYYNSRGCRGTCSEINRPKDLNGHRIIAQACMRYLLLDDFQDAGSDSATAGASPDSPTFSFGPTQERVADRTTDDLPAVLSFEALFKTEEEVMAESAKSKAGRYELYDYSARYWTSHFAECQHGRDPGLTQSAILLCSSESQNEWFSYLTAIEGGLESFPIQPDTLTLCSFFGHHVSVEKLISDDGSISQSGPAMFWAAHNGHTSCIELLLPNSTSELASCYHHGHSPLAIAAKNGHQTCVEAILSYRTFDINGQDFQHRTPLLLAARAGHIEVVTVLLKQEDVDVNLPDSRGASPLLWAVGSNSLEGVKIIYQDPRADIQHRDGDSRDALSWACGLGFSDAVKFLFNPRESDINYKDRVGKTPLMHAIISGNLSTVKQVVKTGRVNANIEDSTGRNAISWAASTRESTILQYLLAKFPAAVDTADSAGWTPLAWTLIGSAYLNNARILLHHGVKDLKAKKGSGTPIIMLAIQWSSFEIAELLVSRDDIDINDVDRRGHSALACAVGAGHLRLVRLILKRPDVDRHVIGIDGMDPQKLAARGGHEEIIRLLEAAD